MICCVQIRDNSFMSRSQLARDIGMSNLADSSSACLGVRSELMAGRISHACDRLCSEASGPMTGPTRASTIGGSLRGWAIETRGCSEKMTRLLLGCAEIRTWTGICFDSVASRSRRRGCLLYSYLYLYANIYTRQLLLTNNNVSSQLQSTLLPI